VFDSHCHLTDGRFDQDRAAVVNGARQAGVTRLVTIASNLDDARAAVELAAEHDGIWSTAGVHPHEVSEAREDDLQGIRELAADRPEVVAIGETGLDFFYDHSPRDLQRTWFEAQLMLAHEVDLPLVIHSREAEDDTIALIRDAPTSTRMVLHCFTGSMRLLEAGLEAGCYVSFSGIVSFAKFDGQEAVRTVPRDRVLAETDSPYLAPVPHRGKRNEPAFIARVLEALADIRGESVEAVDACTTANANRFYALEL
jgi:TatD DNase family protein